MRPCILHWAPVLIACAVSTGCRSTSSIFLQRFDGDQMAGNSNGEVGIHDNAKPFKGIPVTLTVPTHVDIVIHEKIFLDANTLEAVPTNRRNLEAVATTVYSDKLFSVDPKRAAAGETIYTMEMNSDSTEARNRQYFKSLKQKVTDETIKDITDALSKFLVKPGTVDDGGQSLTDEPTVSGGLIEMNRHVAWKRFDVSSPDFEHQIQAFVDEHLNSCHATCCLMTSAPVADAPVPVVQ